jgi:Xaa-Pro dipeptidase
MYANRIARLQRLMKNSGLEIIALNPSPTLAYLTGLSFHLSERPVVALFTQDNSPVMVLPELEKSKAENIQFDMRLIAYGEEQTSRRWAFAEAISRLQVPHKQVGIDPLMMRFFEMRLLEIAFRHTTFVDASHALQNMRIAKDEVEIAAMRRAVIVAEDAMRAILPIVKVGISEVEIASELFIQLLKAGSEGNLPFEPIVASGPNSALPHAIPSDRKLEVGDLLLIDWGARVDGYVSDLTRTFAIEQLDPELAKVHETVCLANATGREAVSTSVSGAEVDLAARDVIEAAGYGEQFIHRLGHGIGLESHEPPYLSSDNRELLQAGNAITIEPGIYLPGRGGVRIEDDVIVTVEGGESLSTFQRELMVIG